MGSKRGPPLYMLIISSVSAIIALVGILSNLSEISIDFGKIFTFLLFPVAMISSVALYFFLRHLKGSMKLVLSKDNFESGEHVGGILDLSAKRKITSNRLFVKLIAEKKMYEQINYVNIVSDTGAGERIIPIDKLKTGPSYWEKFYESESVLESSRTYPAGYKGTYSFKIMVPSVDELETKNISKALLESIDGVMQKADGTDELKWTIRADLDAKGIDLTASKELNIMVLRNR